VGKAKKEPGTSEYTRMIMTCIADLVKAYLNKVGIKAHFTVLVWTPGGVNYISNAERESIKAAMIEVLGRWETKEDEIMLHPGYKQ
jgi:hypothetical protein